MRDASTEIRAVRLHQPEQNPEHIAAWQNLARHATEDNPFYEPWMLMPALQQLGESDGVELLFLYRGTEMVGMFPLQKQRKYRAFPISHYQLWIHRHCYLCTPLIRKGTEPETVEAFFGWLIEQGSSRLLAWNWASEDGPIHKALTQLAERESWTLRKTSYERAVLRGRTDGEEYLKTALSGKHRRDFGRLEKRLSELGDYTYSQVENETEARQWLDSFFELESCGWKGREGTAMNTNPGDREFMRSIVLSAYASKRAILSFSKLDGKAIACKVDFIVNKSSFSFKVAFSEEHSKFRPGLLLELWRLKMLSSTGCEFFDSCSMPGSIFDRLWADRRKIANISVATRTFPEALLVSIYPILKRWALKALKLRESLLNSGTRGRAKLSQAQASSSSGPGTDDAA